MKLRLVEALLRLYRRLALSGMLDRPRLRRAFESAYLAYKLLIEAGPVARLQPFVPPGCVVVDVGANIGFFSTRFARWVGANGRVYAVEPEARNFSSLRARIERTGLDGVVRCVHAAASDHPGTVELVLNPIHPGDHHLGAGGEPVTAVTVDALTADDPRPVGLIKIDVQGAEPLVLAGAERVLAEHRPAIFVEVDEPSLQRFGSSASELIGSLAERGYRGHVLTRAGLGEAEAPEALVTRAASAYIDVLFLPNGG